MKNLIFSFLVVAFHGLNYCTAATAETEEYKVNDFEKTLLKHSNTTDLPPIILPIEVLGAEGKVASRSFTINQQTLNSTANIWLMINNLSFENKGSVRINNGTWLSLNHLTVQMQIQEKQRGGMTHGGYNTIRFTIPKTGLIAGDNTIDFRFNKSNGISIGYRVVRLNLLDTNKNKLLPASMFEEDNPNNWTGPFTDQASITLGKNLWENANLWNHYLPEGEKGFWYGQEIPATKPINAKCASCHTQDGRDLEMFSYSNLSIIERSKFHKLTDLEGQQVASYIRSLSQPATPPNNIGRYGRPWNPPYQPGPALQNKPINQWAAGAGIDAVLEEDKDMAPYLFPDGITSQTVRAAFNSGLMDDRTLLPLAIQFPDWKHWLPLIHPLDAYSNNNYILDPNRIRKPLTAIQNLRTYMTAQPPSTRDKVQLINEISKLWIPFRQFLAEGSSDPKHWRTEDGTANMNLAQDVPKEFAATSLARLLAVKNFELNVEFELQDKASWFVIPDDQPSARQWPNNVYSVFEVPAHFTACVSPNNCQQFTGQATATGQYETTAWYNLQYVLNGGNGFVGGVTPTDFNYHAPFIAYASVSSGIPEPLRYYSALNQMYQIRSWSKSEINGPGGDGFRMRNQGPFHFLGIHQTSRFYYNPPETFLHFLNNVEPNLSKWVLEAQLLQFLAEVNKPENNLVDWPREAPHGGDSALDPVTKSTVVNIAVVKEFGQYADKMYYSIPKFIAEGVDCTIINQIVDWCAAAWPLIDYNSLRGICNPTLTTIDNKNSDKEIVIYPNPTNATLNIEIPKTLFNKQAEIVIYDVLGKKIKTQSTSKNSVIINIENLAKGSYIVKITSNGHLVTETFIKK